MDTRLLGLKGGVWVTSELIEVFELYIPALLTGPPVPGLSPVSEPCEILRSRAVAADTGRRSGILENPLVLRVLTLA